jgi:predicted nucleic acid-binding protein
MILADTSIWIDHFRHSDPRLESILENDQIFMHPLVLGELALGNLSPRAKLLADLKDLPQIDTAMDDEVLRFVEVHKLFGIGIGYIDAHLLVSARLVPDTTIWTRDKRLESAAARLGLNEKSH